MALTITCDCCGSREQASLLPYTPDNRPYLSGGTIAAVQNVTQELLIGDGGTLLVKQTVVKRDLCVSCSEHFARYVATHTFARQAEKAA